jgi:FAD/FMN-containing dehydrogenase
LHTDRALARPPRAPRAAAVQLNDVHAQLNPSCPALYRRPESLAELRLGLAQARRRGLSVAIAGGRHAMGGQQFLQDGCVLDMRALNRILEFDRERGLISVEAGITWPELMRGYLARREGCTPRWGIRQKQTGADHLTIGGAIAANIHGRGLTSPPFSVDVESLAVLNAAGELVQCSRREEPELFSLVVGGYGLAGIVASATLRLVARRKLERVVERLTLPQLMAGFESRIAAGYLYGDFQFATDAGGQAFLHEGIFCCYRPVDPQRPIPAQQLRLTPAQWRRLLWLAHVDKAQAFAEFADFYLRSSGQLYWSDTHQLNIYLDDYHRALDERLGARVPGTEMISELYVPRARLAPFMAAVREDFRRHEVDLIYGTIRLTEADQDACLRWAKHNYACVIFNLHVAHCAAGLAKARADFRRLIDRAIECGGSYFLSYHRYARRDQLLRCYPEFPHFLERKLSWDPRECFASDWYRHYRAWFAEPA